MEEVVGNRGEEGMGTVWEVRAGDEREEGCGKDGQSPVRGGWKA